MRGGSAAAAAALMVAPILGPCPAAATDFRQLSQDGTLVTVFDPDAAEVLGDMRVATFYSASTEAKVFSRTRLRFDCAKRLVRPEAIAPVDPATGKVGPDRALDGGWAPADRATRDSRVFKLVCGPAAERNNYASSLPQTDWRAALKVAFAPMRGAFATAFDLPVGAADLTCTGASVLRPESTAPVVANGVFRVSVDAAARTVTVREPIGPGIAQRYEITRSADDGFALAGPDAAGTLVFASRDLRLKGTRADAEGGGAYAVDLHCAAQRPP